MRTSYPNELWHHGILGQKWGVRRYQFPDGRLTAAGRKRYVKDITSKKYSSYKEARDSARQGINEGTVKNLSELKESLSKFREAATKNEEFDYSPEYKKAQIKAYNNTLEDLKKDRPEYIQEIVQLNNGSEENLDKFHDFRKTLEAYEDEYLSKAEREYYKDPVRKQLKKQEEESLEAYLNECKKATNDLVGKYGSEIIKYDSKKLNNSAWAYGSKTVEDIVKSAIDGYVSDMVKAED